MSNTLKFGNGNWATKEGSALAYNDENNNFKPLPFSFERDSSATVINKDGLIETVGSGEPRIDFKDNIKGALKLEPSRTNVIINSENLNGAGWSVYGASGGTVTRTSNYGISPSGELNSTRVVFSDTTTALYASASGITDNASASIYVKGTVGEIIGFGFGGSVAGGSDFIFNGEWQRLEFNGTSASSNLTINTWSASRNARDFEVYGVQMEQGSYATSYIPTSGSAVTRVAESCSQTLPSAVPTSGVIYTEIELFNSVLDTSSTAIRYGINQTISSGNWIFFGIESGDNLRVYIRANDSTNFDYTLNNVFATAGVYKIAMRFAPNDTKVFVNGVQRASSENTVIASNLNNLNISGGGTAPSSVNNSVKNRDFRLYNTALTDQELIALTTI